MANDKPVAPASTSFCHSSSCPMRRARTQYFLLRSPSMANAPSVWLNTEMVFILSKSLVKAETVTPSMAFPLAFVTLPLMVLASMKAVDATRARNMAAVFMVSLFFMIMVYSNNGLFDVVGGIEYRGIQYEVSKVLVGDVVEEIQESH